MHTLSKDTIGSPRKIDAAMAAVLSWEARSDCVAAGAVHLGADPTPEPEPQQDSYRYGHAPAADQIFVPSNINAGPMPV